MGKRSQRPTAPQAQHDGPCRTRIVAAARTVFVEDGYEHLSAVAVARRARVSRGAVARLFPSRRALLAGVIQEEVEHLVGRLTVRVPEHAPLEEMLAIAFRVFLEFAHERRAEYEMVSGHAAKLDPDVAEVIVEFRQQLAGVYQRLFRPALEAAGFGRRDDGESLLITHAAMAMAEGAILGWLAEPVLPRERMEALVVGMLRRAIGPSTDEPASRPVPMDAAVSDSAGRPSRPLSRRTGATELFLVTRTG